MKATELRALVRWQKSTISQQEQRIKLLEDKVEEVRKKYFHLKYPEDVLLHPQRKQRIVN